VEVTIIGAGIVGLCSALELMRSGVQVRIFEQSAVGRESSWAGGGILWPLYPWRYPAAVHQLGQYSRTIYPELCQELASTTGIDAEYQVSGVLIPEVDAVDQARRWAVTADESVQFLSAQEAAELEPALARPEAAAYFPQAAQLRNPRFLQAITEYLRRGGVRFHLDEPILAIEQHQGKVSGILSKQGRYSLSGPLVIAAGAWSGELLKSFGAALPIRPVRGQMLLLRGQPGLMRRIILRNDHYVIPRADGHVLVGSTLEDVGFDKSITEQARQDLQRAAADLSPVLATLPVVTQWAGLRPGSPDGVPVIAAHPTLAGVFVNAGHFRNGVLLAPASARLLSDLIWSQTPVFDPTLYSYPAS